MQLHNIQRKTKNKKPVQVGRGGRRGKTSGRGTKGQKARAGHKLRPELRDIIKRLPKRRGYFFNVISDKPQVLNVALLNARFEKGEVISPDTLAQKGMLRKTKSMNVQVKILGNGEVTKALSVKGCLVSLPAKVKIEKAGGSVI